MSTEKEKPATAMVPSNATQVALYSKVGDPVAYWANEKLAKAAASILKAPLEQGPAILMHAHARNVDVFALARDYDWIMGKPTMKASAMLSNFRLNHGGDFEVVESSPKRAAVKFTDPKGRVTTWEVKPINLLLSRWPWKKEDGGWRARCAEVRAMLAAGHSEDSIWASMSKHFGDNYGTEEDWENMLWSRLVSKTLKKVCPELTSGVYTPEEMRDVEAIDVAFTTASASPKTAEEFLAEQLAAAQESAEKEEGEVVDAEFEVVDEPAKEAPETPVDPEAPGTVSESDRALIEQLFDECRISPEDRQKALSKRNANVTRNLSANAAASLLANLRNMQTRAKQQASGN